MIELVKEIGLQDVPTKPVLRHVEGETHRSRLMRFVPQRILREIYSYLLRLRKYTIKQAIG